MGLLGAGSLCACFQPLRVFIAENHKDAFEQCGLKHTERGGG